MAAKPYDPTIKALVETVPEDWPVLVGLPRAPTDVIDADIATVSGAADKVLQVNGRPPCLLHLEFVSGHDAVDQPDLLHLRSTLLRHRHRLVVRSAAVLLRPEADSPTLTGELATAFPGEPPYDVFRYQVVRGWQLPVEQLLAAGVGTLPLAPISAVTEADLPGIIQQMGERLSRRGMRRRVETLWGATYILMGLRYSPAVAEQLLRGVMSMKESSTYQAILAEGMAEGIAKGMAKGMARGIAEGEVRGAVAEARKFLLMLGTTRFGSPDTETGAALEAIDDLRRLEDLGSRLLSVNSWQELLGRTRRRRNGRRPRTR